MAYDQELARRVRKLLSRRKGFSEKNMFGGVCFLINGNMCCGVEKHRLMLRVGPEQYEACLKLPHARKMDFTGKPLRGFLYISQKGIDDDDKLRMWVEKGLHFVKGLPKK